MTSSIHRTAYQLAMWDAAKQAKRDDGSLPRDYPLEEVAYSLLEQQGQWYLERAARLRRVQQ